MYAGGGKLNNRETKRGEMIKTRCQGNFLLLLFNKNTAPQDKVLLPKLLITNSQSGRQDWYMLPYPGKGADFISSFTPLVTAGKEKKHRLVLLQIKCQMKSIFGLFWAVKLW